MPSFRMSVTIFACAFSSLFLIVKAEDIKEDWIKVPFKYSVITNKASSVPKDEYCETEACTSKKLAESRIYKASKKELIALVDFFFNKIQVGDCGYLTAKLPDYFPDHKHYYPSLYLSQPFPKPEAGKETRSPTFKYGYILTAIVCREFHTEVHIDRPAYGQIPVLGHSEKELHFDLFKKLINDLDQFSKDYIVEKNYQRLVYFHKNNDD